jgi:hypothetical protein
VRQGWHRTNNGKGSENNELGIGFFVRKIIISGVKKLEFVSDRKSNIVVNVRAPK